MKLLTSFLIYCWIVNAESKATFPSGYYWRDYIGEIPSDALPGGFSRKNETFYIGQAIHKPMGILVPGKIDPKTKTLYYEMSHKEYSSKTDVKIFCTMNPIPFRWAEAQEGDNVTDVLLDTEELINGGHENTYLITVGTKLVDNVFQVGKVPVVDDKFGAIRLTKDGKGWTETLFRVLVHDRSLARVEELEFGPKIININIS